MTIITATRDELKAITGLQRPSAIKRFLAENRIPFIEGADGWPRVLHAIIMEKLGGAVSIAPLRNEPQMRL